MAIKKQSIAPRERINITYQPATDGEEVQKELPLRMLLIGDWNGRPSDEELAHRDAIKVTNNNFRDVMRSQDLALDLEVENELRPEGAPKETAKISLQFESMEDFEPDSIVNQLRSGDNLGKLPELEELFKLRDALSSLRRPLGTVASFRKQLQALVSDPETAEKFIQELKSSS